MMISISRTSRRARVAILAALLASLTTPALAESQRANFRPGTAKVYVGKLESVQSTRHYQAYGVLACEGNVCNVAFPPPGANHRLNLTHVSCVVTTLPGAQFQRSLVGLSANNNVLMTYPVPLVW